MPDLVTKFTSQYYDTASWSQTKWMGTPVLKCPVDLWIYQEILYACRPALIIECGTWCGGSALFLAHLCDLLGHGMVLSIDLEDFSSQGWERPVHNRILYAFGNDTDPQTFAELKEFVTVTNSFPSIMVILDSDHRERHVYRQLKLYSDLVTVGQYLIVEDTVLSAEVGRPSARHIPGPAPAVARFLAEDKRFEADHQKESHLLTFNPNGYLKRIG